MKIKSLISAVVASLIFAAPAAATTSRLRWSNRQPLLAARKAPKLRDILANPYPKEKP
jgi:hypothetical protein